VGEAPKTGASLSETNTVHSTNRGAVLSCREPPDLGTKYQNIKGLNQDIRNDLDKILVVSGDKTRQLFSARLSSLRPRRLNASVKQVMAGLFSGHDPSWAGVEDSVIRKVLHAAQSYKPGLTPLYNKAQAENLLNSAETVVETLKDAIAKTVRDYLRLLLGRFSDARFNLTWHVRSNNCQAFCDNILLVPELTTVFPAGHVSAKAKLSPPNYLLSFTARFPALSEESFAASKLDSYFRSFHQDLDIIDSYDAENEFTSSSAQHESGKYDSAVLQTFGN
jgi:hypothetical protein